MLKLLVVTTMLISCGDGNQYTCKEGAVTLNECEQLQVNSPTVIEQVER